MLTITRMKSALAITVLLAAGFSAQAADTGKKLKASGDWSLWQTKTGTLCYMQSGGENDAYMVLIKAKNNPRSPVEMMIQLLKNGKGHTAGSVSVPGVNSTIAFGDLDGKKATFQAVPKNLATVVETIKNSKPQVKINLIGGKSTQEIKISTKGFKEIVKEMESACNAGAPLVDADFEAKFINAVADNVNPAVLSPAKSADIRSVYFAAYPVLLDKKTAESELSAVLNRYRPSQDELANNRSTATRLQNSDIPGARADLAKTQTQQTTSRAEITRLEKEIGPLDAKVKASQKALDEVEDKIAPLRPKVNSLSSSLSNASSKNSSATSRLAYINGRIPQIDQITGQLQGEANFLSTNLPAQQLEARAAGNRYNTAYQNRANYNAQWRRDSLLAANNEYQRLGNSWTNMDNRRDDAEGDLRDLRRERDRVAGELRSCQNGSVAPNATLIKQLVPGGPGLFPPKEPKPPGGGGKPGGGGLIPGGPGNGGGNGPGNGPGNGGGLIPGGPGNGGGGLTPGPTDPPDDGGGLTPVAPDCSNWEDALRVANSQISQKQSEINGYEARLREIEDARAVIARRMDSIVAEEVRDLQTAEDQARYASEQATSIVNANTARLNQISMTELPNLARERSDLVNEKPGVQADIASSKADMNKFSAELAAYKKANDWDKKEAAVNAKAAVLRQDQSALDVATSSKALAERTLATAISREVEINAKITRLNSELAALNTRAVALDAIVAKLPGERAPIDARISALEADLKAKQERVLNNVR